MYARADISGALCGSADAAVRFRNNFVRSSSRQGLPVAGIGQSGYPGHLAHQAATSAGCRGPSGW